MILNLSEIRTQLKALTLAVSKSKAVEGTSNNKGDLDTDDIGCDDDTLHGLPAIDMETWQQFNDKLTTDIKFRKAVVKVILESFSYMLWFGQIFFLVLLVTCFLLFL